MILKLETKIYILSIFTGKPWDVVEYGVCEIGDILGEVSENTVVVSSLNGDDQLIAIPKREQTPEEIEKTKQFAVEVKYCIKQIFFYLISN